MGIIIRDPEKNQPTKASRLHGLRLVVTSQAWLFIPFVLAVLLTVNHSAPKRTCPATEWYSSFMSQFTPGDDQGAVTRFALSALHTVTPLLVLFVCFIALCCVIQLLTIARIVLRRRYSAFPETCHTLIMFVTPVVLVVVLQHADRVPVLRGCELPALTTSWIPWIPDSWFRTGLSWVLFIVSSFILMIIASALPGKGPMLFDEK